MTTIHSCDVAPGFEDVSRVFEGFLSRGWDIGSAFSAYLDGRPVVSLCGGVRDRSAAAQAPYDRHTLQLIASASKFVESMCVALLVDRGLLRYGDRIADHWPELAANDARKADITVRQLMMHRAGLPFFDQNLTERELFHPEALARFLERQVQAPELFQPEPPGGGFQTQRPAPPQAYHAISRGLYASELLRRVDPKHRTMGQFLRDELATPLGLELWIGLPESEEGRISPPHVDVAPIMKLLGLGGDSAMDLNDPRYALFDHEIEFLRRLITQPGSVQHRSLNCISFEGVPPQALGNHRLIRACEAPSSNGVSNAESLAKLAALAAGGGAFSGVAIFKGPEALAQAAACAETYATDASMLTPVAFTQGGFARLLAEDDERTETVGWGGAGGQMVRFVPSLRIGCAYLTNTNGVRMAMNDPRPSALLKATIDCARRLPEGALR